MNIFRWLFSPSQFERIPDAFTLDRKLLWAEILKAIEFQRQQGAVVWLLTHFAEPFFDLQSQLNHWQIDYQIVTQRMNPNELAQISRSQPTTIHLALAELLSATELSNVVVDDPLKISILAIERHPLIDFDRQLDLFVRQIPAQVKFGYYLALNDPAVSGLVSKSLVTMLKQFGMKEGDLINSITATRAIERMLKKFAATYDRSIRADSAAEWIALQQARQKDAKD